jgi:hypothetical protein
MRTRIKGLGDVGLITDRDAHDLPQNGWSTLHNIRCDNGAIEPVVGYEDATTGTSALSPSGTTEDVHVHQLGLIQDDADFYFVFAWDSDDDGDPEKLYTWDGDVGTASVDRTRTTGAYTGTASDLWVFSEFNGLIIATNGVDAPQYWGPDLTDFTYLPYDGTTTWVEVAGAGETEFDTDDDASSTTNNYKAKVIRPLKNYLFALGITEEVGASKTATFYPQLVHWSNPADPGTVPTSWDYNTASNDAGRTPLPESAGQLLDLIPMGDIGILYTETSYYRVSYIGGEFIWDFDIIASDRGLWATNCAVDIGGGRHVCLGNGVVFMHSGGEPTDILEGFAAKALFDAIDEVEYKKTFLYHRKNEQEVWICYPAAGETWCTAAYVYNYHNRTWHTRDLPPCSSIVDGIITASENADWDSEAVLDWDSEGDLDWASRAYSPIADTPIAGGQQLVKFMGETSDSPVAQKEGVLIEDNDDWHMIRRLMPRATGDSMSVQVGTQDVVDGLITWESAQTFTPGTDYKLDERVSSRVFSLRVTGTGTWRLSEIGVDFTKVGRR